MVLVGFSCVCVCLLSGFEIEVEYGFWFGQLVGDWGDGLVDVLLGCGGVQIFLALRMCLFV